MTNLTDLFDNCETIAEYHCRRIREYCQEADRNPKANPYDLNLQGGIGVEKNNNNNPYDLNKSGFQEWKNRNNNLLYEIQTQRILPLSRFKKEIQVEKSRRI